MKILIVGGLAQNKLRYALERFGFAEADVADENSGDEALRTRPVLNRLHAMVKRRMREDNTAAGLLELLDARSDWLVVCDEVGCGVVPVDAFERAWREEAGRLCCALAARADVVERVTCGIAQRLKGGYCENSADSAWPDNR